MLRTLQQSLRIGVKSRGLAGRTIIVDTDDVFIWSKNNMYGHKLQGA